jgi:hypothetical protein
MSDKKQFITINNNRFNVIESMNDSELKVSVKFFEWTSYELHYVIDNKLVLVESYTADTYGWAWEQPIYYSIESIHIHPKYVTYIDSITTWIKLMKYED